MCVLILKLALESLHVCCFQKPHMDLMTHKYRGCIAVFSISKSVEPNEEQKVLASGMDQEFSANT